MDDYTSRPAPAGNPKTRRRHQQEMFWQVTLPMLAGGLILLALTVLVVLGGIRGGELGRWAGISLIWLITPLMVVTLIGLLVLIGSIYGLVRLIQAIPRLSYQALGWMLLLGLYIRRFGDRLVEPVLRAQMAAASLKALRRRR